MKQDYEIEDIWVPHELHPETPSEGQPIAEVFDQFDVDQVTFACRQKGAPYGLEFADMKVLSNTRLALQAAEFARDAGKYHEFHAAAFKAYFAEGRNIGDVDVLGDVARLCGLDEQGMMDALDNGMYARRVSEGSKAARDAGVRAIPAFHIEGCDPIVGAVSEERFREILSKLVSVQ